MKNLSKNKRKELTVKYKLRKLKHDKKLLQLKFQKDFIKEHKSELKILKEKFKNMFLVDPLNSQALIKKPPKFDFPDYLNLQSTKFKLKELDIDESQFKGVNFHKKYRKDLQTMENLRKECNPELSDEEVEEKEEDVLKKELELLQENHKDGEYMISKFKLFHTEIKIRGLEENSNLSLPKKKKKKPTGKLRSKKTCLRTTMGLHRNQPSLQQISDRFKALTNNEYKALIEEGESSAEGSSFDENMSEESQSNSELNHNNIQ